MVFKIVDKQAALVERWLDHCEAVGHVPATQGGTARYDINLAHTYIKCCECEWSRNGLPTLKGAVPS